MLRQLAIMVCTSVYFVSDPWHRAPFGLITDANLAAKFSMTASKTVYIFRTLNHTLVRLHIRHTSLVAVVRTAINLFVKDILML